jgi:DNA-binding Lrp family transcriptional regulator
MKFGLSSPGVDTTIIINENTVMAKTKTTTKKRPRGRPKGSTKYTDQIKKKLSYTQLDPVDRTMLAIVIANPAISNTKLSKQIGLDNRTTKKRRDRGLFQLELLKAQQTAIEKCKEAQTKAADVLIDLLQSTDEKVRLDAAKFLLKPVVPNTSIIKAEGDFSLTIDNMDNQQLDAFIKGGIDALDIVDADFEVSDG